MTTTFLIFIALAIIAIAAAAGLILSRNPVYSALFLILNFLAVGVFYLILGAPFIALAQITVYAGAIMVLFLFVIMLLGAAKPKEVEPHQVAASARHCARGAILVEGLYALITRVSITVTTTAPARIACRSQNHCPVALQQILPALRDYLHHLAGGSHWRGCAEQEIH